MTFAAKVTAMAGYVPERVVPNVELAESAGVDDAWVVQRTGISCRHWAGAGTSTSDLAVEAGRRALEQQRSKVDTVILATATPDHPVPATAPNVASRLGLGDATAFDVAAVCSGFLYGLKLGVSLVHSRMSQSLLVIGAETFSKIIHPMHRDVYPLFGDGAGAWVLAHSENPGPGSVLSVVTGSDGSLHELIVVRAGGSRLPRSVDDMDSYLTMQGRPVFQNAVRRMAETALGALGRAGVDAHDVRWVLAHQANIRILQALAERLKIPLERFVTNIESVGNTSAASIPLLSASDDVSTRAQADDLVLLIAFGAGLTWGSAVLRWPEAATPKSSEN